MAHRFLATWLAIGLASASPKARLEEIDAWLVGGREAPKHWAVRAPGDREFRIGIIRDQRSGTR